MVNSMIAVINGMGVIKCFLGDNACKQNLAPLLQSDQMKDKWAGCSS